MLPYIAFLVILYPITYWFPSINLNSFLRYFTRFIVGGRFLVGNLAVFWFVTCLFFTQQIVNFLVVKFQPNTVKIIIFLFLSLSYCNSFFFPDLWLPLNTNVVLAAAPIFYIGYLYKNKQVRLNEFLLLFIGVLVVGSSFLLRSNTYDMKYANYGLPIITLFSSVILTLNIRCFSKILSQIKIPSYVFSKLGNSSMVVMYLHQPIQFFIKEEITENNFVRVFLAIGISHIVYMLLDKFLLTKILFLGSSKGFLAVRDILKSKSKLFYS